MHPLGLSFCMCSSKCSKFLRKPPKAQTAGQKYENFEKLTPEIFKLQTRGKPSTWLPRGGLVELWDCWKATQTKDSAKEAKKPTTTKKTTKKRERNNWHYKKIRISKNMNVNVNTHDHITRSLTSKWNKILNIRVHVHATISLPQSTTNISLHISINITFTFELTLILTCTFTLTCSAPLK